MKRIYKNLFRNSLLQKILGFLIFLYLKFVYFTSKKTYIYPKNFAIYEKSKGCIVVFWHNRLVLAPFLTRKGERNNALISSHSDGLFLKQIFQLFKVKITLGSTNRNASYAVRKIITSLRFGEKMWIAVDGPRGPIYQVNSAAATIAQRNNVPVLPISYNCKRKITLSSWDKMIIPLPFNNIVFRYGEVLVLSKSDKKGTKELNGIIKKALDSISDKAGDF